MDCWTIPWAPWPDPVMPPTSETLTVGDVELTIDLAAGARAIRWTVGDLSLLGHHGDAPVNHGMYPMAPWAGRLRDNSLDFGGQRYAFPATHDAWALHGTLLDRAPDVVEHVQDAGVARLVAHFTDGLGWPWPMAVDVEWELRERALTTAITVTALETAFPVVVGWHPWFRRDLGSGRPLEWTMPATLQAERGPDHLPTGRLLPARLSAGPFDDAFMVPGGRALVRWPGALALDISSDAGWYVVFDELAATACIEPQSGPPDGINDGLGQPVTLASPGHPHRLVTTWTMSDDPPGDRS